MSVPPARQNADDSEQGPQRRLAALAAIVDEHIRNAIASKELRPGTVIDFNALARELNMSRTPIRESIRSLHNAGLLEAINGGQFRVAILDQRKQAAFYAVRMALEAAATRMAATAISEIELELLQHNLEIFSDPATSQAQLPAIDRQFHEIIYEASRNRYLATRLKSLREVLGLIPRTSFETPERIRQIHAEHNAIFAALRRRDAQGAAVAALAHIRAAMNEPLDGEAYGG